MTDTACEHALVALLEMSDAAPGTVTVTDVLKLLYQSEYGCGHLLTGGEDDALERLRGEYASCKTPPNGEFACVEPVGDRYSRINLAPSRAAGVDCDLIGRAFIVSARKAPDAGADGRFADKVNGFIEDGAARHGFDPRAVREFYDGWVNGGRRPFSHSEAYRAAYAPAYRVVSSRVAAAMPLLNLLWNRRFGAGGRRFVAAIDGRCGSGKSTVADVARDVCGAVVIRADDFFLPPHMRTPERLAEPGGNLDRERFYDEVVSKLADGDAFSYGVFDCSCGEITSRVTVPSAAEAPLVVVEGAYCQHPAFGGYADLRVFCDVVPDVQLRRIGERDGDDAIAAFRDRWIPMEEKYLKAYSIAGRCSLTLAP